LILVRGGAAVVLTAVAVLLEVRSAQGAEERQVVFYTPWVNCIGNPTTPFCALETLFSCMVRGDWGMCATVGIPPDANCRPSHITGVRYSVDQVMHRGAAAYLTFRAEVCRDERPCPAPARTQTEELENAGDTWRFLESPRVYELACRPL